jgi:putative intracellular protease/amidase
MNGMKRVLIIVTSASELSPGEATGIWLEEFAVPYMAFTGQGFNVSVASIGGGPAPVDPRSEASSDMRLQWQPAIEALVNTLPLERLDPADFDAVFLPGGHGTMIDFPQSEALQALLRGFAEGDKIIAAVCHGPASLVNVMMADGTPLVAGKVLTGFTDQEESVAGLTDKVPFLLESRLRAQGAQFVAKPEWSDHVEVDGRLITGQNPQSTRRIAETVIEALDATGMG